MACSELCEFGNGLIVIHGREAAFASETARSEERGVDIPRERRATKQNARKGASRTGFAPLAEGGTQAGSGGGDLRVLGQVLAARMPSRK